MIKRKWANEEVEEYRKTHASPFYFNKEDSNVLVPKTYGIGLTVNWGNPISWVFILFVACLIIWRKFLK